MPTDGSARRVLSLRLGISAILDMTGMTIFRVVRPGLPDPPPPGSRPDPFRAAMDTIVAAHREVVGQAPGQSEVAVQTPGKREVAVQTPDKTGVTLPA